MLLFDLIGYISKTVNFVLLLYYFSLIMAPMNSMSCPEGILIASLRNEAFFPGRFACVCVRTCVCVWSAYIRLAQVATTCQLVSCGGPAADPLCMLLCTTACINMQFIAEAENRVWPSETTHQLANH